MAIGKPLVIRTKDEQLQAADLQKVLDVLAGGGLVAFPTETVYGVGVDGFNEEAVKALAKAKNRPPDSPFALQIGKKEQAYSLVEELPKDAQDLMEVFWPGPLTIILPASKMVLPVVIASGDTVALRFSSHPLAQALPLALGRPLAATSANFSRGLSPTRAEEVLAEFGSQLDILIDAGPANFGIESTIIDLAISPPEILRPGTIDQESLEIVLGKKIKLKISDNGEKYHPQIPIFICLGDLDLAGDKIRKMGFKEPAYLGPEEISRPWFKARRFLTGDSKSLKDLFALLRFLENTSDVIIVIPPKKGPFVNLIVDRLKNLGTSID